MKDQVILYLTHRTDESAMHSYRRIESSCKSSFDIKVLHDDKTGFDTWPVPVYKVSLSQSKALGYRTGRNRTFTPGLTDTAVLQFFKNHKEYQYYWLVEYDVDYSGNWLDFYCLFNDSDADFLGPYIQRFSDCPNWPWWRTLRNARNEKLPENDRIRGFFPVYRISARALEALHSARVRGWRGHAEALLPTLFNQKRFKIEDLGGLGSFTPPERLNRCYFQAGPEAMEALNNAESSLRYRPVMDWPGNYSDTLWHPLKYRRFPYIQTQDVGLLEQEFGTYRAGDIVSTNTRFCLQHCSGRFVITDHSEANTISVNPFTAEFWHISLNQPTLRQLTLELLDRFPGKLFPVEREIKSIFDRLLKLEVITLSPPSSEN